MERIVRRSLAVVGLGLAMIACGTGPSDGETVGDGGASVDARPGDRPDARLVAEPDARPAGPIAAADLCRQLTTLLCAAEQACCTDAGKRHATEAECFSNQNADCLRDLQSPASDSRTGYDPAIARAEFNELAGRLASCDTVIGPWFVSHQGLLRIYQGTVESGGDCTPANTSDSVPVLSCKAPLVCQLGAFGSQCGSERQSQDSCLAEIECRDGLRCDPPESLSGRCVDRLADGSGCEIDGDCQSLICEARSCVPATADRVYCFDLD